MGSRRRLQVVIVMGISENVQIPLVAFNSPLKKPQCCLSSKASSWLPKALQTHLLTSNTRVPVPWEAVAPKMHGPVWDVLRRSETPGSPEAKQEKLNMSDSLQWGSLAVTWAWRRPAWLPGVTVLLKKSLRILGGGADCSAWSQAVFSNSLWWEHHPFCRVPKTLPNHLCSEFLGTAQLRANGTNQTHAHTKNEFCLAPGAEPSADVNGQQWH